MDKHDQWFRDQVAQALVEADDPATEWVSNEEANASWDKLRVELMGRIENKA